MRNYGVIVQKESSGPCNPLQYIVPSHPPVFLSRTSSSRLPNMNTFPSLEMRHVEWAPQAPPTMCWSFSLMIRLSFEGFTCCCRPTRSGGETEEEGERMREEEEEGERGGGKEGGRDRGTVKEGGKEGRDRGGGGRNRGGEREGGTEEEGKG